MNPNKEAHREAHRQIEPTHGYSIFCPDCRQRFSSQVSMDKAERQLEDHCHGKVVEIRNLCGMSLHRKNGDTICVLDMRLPNGRVRTIRFEIESESKFVHALETIGNTNRAFANVCGELSDGA